MQQFKTFYTSSGKIRGAFQPPVSRLSCAYSFSARAFASAMALPHKISDFAGTPHLTQIAGNESRRFRGFTCGKTLVRAIWRGARADAANLCLLLLSQGLRFRDGLAPQNLRFCGDPAFDSNRRE